MEYETRSVKTDAGTWTFECACGFTSSGWALRKLADARGAEHTTEHATSEPMRELVEFRAEHDLNGALVTKVGFES